MYVSVSLLSFSFNHSAREKLCPNENKKVRWGGVALSSFSNTVGDGNDHVDKKVSSMHILSILHTWCVCVCERYHSYCCLMVATAALHPARAIDTICAIFSEDRNCL